MSTPKDQTLILMPFPALLREKLARKKYSAKSCAPLKAALFCLLVLGLLFATFSTPARGKEFRVAFSGIETQVMRLLPV